MSTAYQRWICDACGFIYDEAQGDPDSGLAPGTRYQDIPDDWQCPLCGLSKSDLRLLPETPSVPPAPAARPALRKNDKCRGGDDYVVIVGAGIAGWSVAEAIRRADPAVPMLLVTACEGLIYPKPALSMALAQGKSAEDLVEADAGSRAQRLGMQVRTETRVIRVDAQKRRLITAKGGIQYGTLILALGAQQRELMVVGEAAADVLRVNDLQTYRKLRRRLDEGVSHITILGAGLIGCEFAEDLGGAGYAVSVLDPAEGPLAGLLPGEMSQDLRQRLADRGVDWRFDTTLARLERWGSSYRAHLSTGAALETDLVLSAAGLVPNIDLAAKTGLAVNRGIQVDRRMRCSLPEIYALGDCAEVDGQVFAYIEPIRRQAETIAANLVGESSEFDAVPSLIRVKTPSLPLSICHRGRLSYHGWNTVELSDQGRRMESRDESGKLLGFALSGRYVRDVGRIYPSVIC